ncbi:DMT family transporter [Roseovarius sp.]|uniref:DMT family transporter n=1 Tax=Roseovarius sp. TaxID=1486281 RepID=UPI00260A5A56|nr:DMT family transporter [Roseovarius sp.]MDM8166777.1 DMT family transporter [Roseovarius sp.]
MSLPKPREERTAAGVLTMFFAVVFFTCIDSSAKWLTLAGLPVMQVVFARYCGHFVYAALVYMPQEGLSAFRSRAPLKQVLRSSFLFGSTVCNFFALQSLPITVTTTITFAGPIVVTLLAIPILGEKVGLRRIAAVCTGFVGVLVVMQPWGAEFHPAMLFSLAALAIASLYFIMTRMLAGVETIATQQLWSSGIASVVLAPVAASVWVWPDSGTEWLVMFLIGGFGMTGHVLATIAHRWADASILAPMVYSQIFLAAIAGIVVFATWPTVWTLGGGVIIIGSGLYIWHRERQKSGVVRRDTRVP